MTANGNEPLVALWAERNRFLALANAAGAKAKSANDVHEKYCYAMSSKMYAIEDRIANTVAETVQGLLVQMKLHEDVAEDCGWTHGAAWTRNVVKALERMEGAAIVGT